MTIRRWRTSSYAVRNDLLALAFALVVLCLGGGAEESLPKFLGVGFPVLLASVQVVAVRRPLAAAMLFAVAAGGLEDALSSLPPMTSVSFFMLAMAFARRADLPHAATLLTYPAYQIWLAAWTGGLGGGVFGRILVSLPIGAVTAFAVGWAICIAERRVALGEQG